MNGKTNTDLMEVVNSLGEAWTFSLITAGLNSGIFSALNDSRPVSVESLALKLKYDPEKLDKWFYFCENAGYVARKDGGYVITPKTAVFMPDSPYKDIIGFARLNDFFMRAAVNSSECFRKNNSLDKLTEGKITRDYQPNVSDNLSAELIKFFHQYNMGENDSLIDIGCGIGAFARSVAKQLPGLKITGFDSNLFAIEWAKKENKQLGLSDRIKMVVGNALEDLGDFADKSFDWVMAINVFHFYPVEHREALIDQMIRISKRGTFFTEIIAEKTRISFAADPLMSLLWNDFTGFFREADAEKLNASVQKKHPEAVFEKHSILQGSSYLMAVIKK